MTFSDWVNAIIVIYMYQYCSGPCVYERQNGVNGLEGKSLGVASLWRQNGVNGLDCPRGGGYRSTVGLMVLVAKRAVGVASYRRIRELLLKGHTLLTCKS